MPTSRAVTAEQVTDAVLAGAWVVDLRGRDTYAGAHLPDVGNLEPTDVLTTTVGWLIPWDDDVTLLADSPELLGAAVQALTELGFDAAGSRALAEDDPAASSAA